MLILQAGGCAVMTVLAMSDGELSRFDTLQVGVRRCRACCAQARPAEQSSV